MKLLIRVLSVVVCLTVAQSRHLKFRPFRGPKFEGRVVEFSIGGNVVKEDTKGIANSTLFSSTSALKRRVDPLNPNPDEQSAPRAMFNNPSCLRCPSKHEMRTPEAILNHYTTEYFLREVLADRATVTDRCIFYTRGLRRTRPITLSGEATRLACRLQKYTIWHLWTNKNDEQADFKHNMNHYDPFDEHNRLNALTEKVPEDPDTGKPLRRPYFIEYFENMSRALALTCNGRIYLYTTEPLRIWLFWDLFHLDGQQKNVFPNIWATTEYPALRGGRYDTTEFIAIDAKSTADRPPAYQIDWNRIDFPRIGDFPLKRDADALSAGNWSEHNLPPWAKPYDLWSEVTVGPETKKQALERRAARSSCLDFEPVEEDDLDYFG
ncbi:hypothetical protein QBC34DRAFT_314190 [Podospora aff. communis PSN243]|uniref:Tyrosinase copper-binding domain-containing protein n=1 Tax=Podospora aff. communis PSN243 TaxID=3040156 RepID=A0AAV9FYD4_9PEZI|nr:hypothetical protein QBC34DRAFT_314190 [Podospora aff. communis PSN243]